MLYKWLVSLAMQTVGRYIQYTGGKAKRSDRLTLRTPSQSHAFDRTDVLPMSEGSDSGLMPKRVLGGPPIE